MRTILIGLRETTNRAYGTSLKILFNPEISCTIGSCMTIIGNDPCMLNIQRDFEAEDKSESANLDHEIQTI